MSERLVSYRSCRNTRLDNTRTTLGCLPRARHRALKLGEVAQKADQAAKNTNDPAKKEAADLVNQANQRANQLVEDAKTSAQEEAERIKISAQNDVEQSTKRAREELRAEVATLAVAGAEKILNSEIDEKKNSEILDELKKEL